MTAIRPRILVAEDDADLRRAVVRRLRGAGYDVVEAADGCAALILVEATPVDVAVLDVMMPGLDGFRLSERLQALAEPPHIVIVSGRGGLDDRLRGLYGGAVDYVTKPFEFEDLLARISVAVRVRARLEEMRAESRVDLLTGLRNRRSFELTIAAEVARALRYQRPLSLAFLDVDGLKAVNDTHGHAAGDDLLRAVGRALLAVCRETDRPARIGGDEFAVVIPETDREGALPLLDRFRAAFVDHRFMANGVSISPSVSIGLAVFPTEANDAAGLRALADRDLYRAKRVVASSAPAAERKAS